MTAANEKSALKREANLLSARDLAGHDIRLVCNAIKRSSALIAATLMSGRNGNEITSAAEKMTLALLKEAGVPPEAQREGHYAYAVTMEAVSVTLEAVAATARGRDLLANDLDRTADSAVGLFVELIKSKQVAKIADNAWSGDIANSTALRLAICTSLTPLSVAMTEFSFEQPPRQILQEAAKLVAKLGIAAADKIAPPQSSPAARTVLQQSMLNSCSKVFLAIWRAKSKFVTLELAGMSAGEQSEALRKLKSAPLADFMNEFAVRLEESFNAVVDISLDLVPLGEQVPKGMREVKLEAATAMTAGPASPQVLSPEGQHKDKPWKRRWAR